MLEATKSITYATRRLRAGDQFEPRSRSDERILIALKRARRVSGDAPAPVVDDLAELRAAYAEKFGKRPFNGWNAEALKAKLAG